LKQYINQLTDAIGTRRSTRSFTESSVEVSDRKKLDDFLKEMKLPFEHTVKISVNSSYGKPSVFIINATSDFAAISTGNSIADLAKAGFAGELFVLYCESLKISTCWIGSFRKGRAMGQVFGPEKNDSGRIMPALVSLGYNPEEKGLLNRVTKKIYSIRRKPLEECLSPDSLRNFPEHIRRPIELALRAPSARNAQYWQFKISGNDNGGYNVKLNKRPQSIKIGWPYPDLDVGIAASHFWLGLESTGIKYTLDIVEKEKTVVWKFVI